MDSFIIHNEEKWRKNIRAYIVDSKKNFLLVKIRGHIGPTWEFVGGGIEEGEKEEQALSREIFEEVGFSDYQIILSSSSVSFERFDPQVFEKLNIDYVGLCIREFLIQVPGITPNIKPQTDEVTEFCWLNINEIMPHLTYGNQASAFKTITGGYHFSKNDG